MKYLGLFLVCVGVLAAQQGGVSSSGRPSRGGPQWPQQAPVREQYKPEDMGKVEGVVRDARTGEPLRKANVTLYPNDNRRGGERRPVIASTDGEGKFSLSAVEPGQYRLAADRPGYVRGEYGAKSPGGVFGSGRSIRVDKRQTLSSIDVELQRHAVVTGRITDEDGDPVQGASVVLLRSRYLQGKKQMAPTGSDNTNDLGEYRIFGVPAGRYLLAVGPRDGGPGRGGVISGDDESYVQTFYPNATDMASASTVILTAGMEAQGMDIRLAKNRTYRVQGRVTGMPADARGSVILIPVEGGFRSWSGGGGGRSAWRGDNGEFDLRGVAPGSYYLQADGFVAPRTRLVGVTPIEVTGRDIEGLSVALGPLGTVSGQIRVDGSGAGPSLSSVGVLVEPKTAGVPMFGNFNGKAGEDGSFEIKDVSPWPSMLRVSPPSGYYIQSIRMAEVDVLEHGLDLIATRSAANIDIVLKEGAGRVDGTALDEKGEPLGGAVVALKSTMQGPFALQLFKQATTDASGAFQMPNIRPGEYKLLALDKVDPMAVQDPELWAQYEGSAVTIKIAEKGQETRALKAVTVSEQFSQ